MRARNRENRIYEDFVSYCLIPSLKEASQAYVDEEETKLVCQKGLGSPLEVFCRRSGYSLSDFRRVLRGEIVPRTDKLMRFAISCGYRFEDFYQLGKISYGFTNDVPMTREIFKTTTMLPAAQLTMIIPRRILKICDFLNYDNEDFRDMLYCMRMSKRDWDRMLLSSSPPSMERICGFAKELEVTIQDIMGLNEIVYHWDVDEPSY